MSVIFNKTSNYKPDDFCSICREPLYKKKFFFWKEEVVAHDGVGGDKHPFHKICLDPWVNEHQSCPMCKESVRVNICKPVRKYIFKNNIILEHKKESLWVNMRIITSLACLILGSVGIILGSSGSTIIGLQISVFITLGAIGLLGLLFVKMVKLAQEITQIDRTLETLHLFELMLRG